MYRLFCDRCGEEIQPWSAATSINLRGKEAAICPDCVQSLYDWMGDMKELSDEDSDSGLTDEPQLEN